MKDVGKSFIHDFIINEVEYPPLEKLQWHSNEPRVTNKNAELVLQHISEKTGLTFTREIRSVKILVAE